MAEETQREPQRREERRERAASFDRTKYDAGNMLDLSP
jgi:hypothetical protein